MIDITLPIDKYPKNLRDYVLDKLGEEFVEANKEPDLIKRTLYFLDFFEQSLDEMEIYKDMVKNSEIDHDENSKEFIETLGNFVVYYNLLESSKKELKSIESYVDIAPISSN